MTADRTTISAETAQRLGKLVPRLATDREGERIATVAAIGRVLESGGLDFNDLGDAIASLGTQPARQVFTFSYDPGAWGERDRPSPGGGRECAPDPGPQPPKFRAMSRSEALIWADWLLAYGGVPSKAAATIRNMRERLWREPHRQFTRAEVRTLNQAIFAAWKAGRGPEASSCAAGGAA